MCKVIAIVNQKGGVAKTTTTVNLGIGLVREGKKVRSYMITTLYNAPVTCSNYYKAEVNHDFYGQG